MKNTIYLTFRSVTGEETNSHSIIAAHRSFDVAASELRQYLLETFKPEDDQSTPIEQWIDECYIENTEDHIEWSVPTDDDYDHSTFIIRPIETEIDIEQAELYAVLHSAIDYENSWSDFNVIEIFDSKEKAIDGIAPYLKEANFFEGWVEDGNPLSDETIDAVIAEHFITDERDKWLVKSYFESDLCNVDLISVEKFYIK
ncbi:MAG: hypothetical protein IJ957_05865 [Rikenellaceae bacterium]|nr:hypothetical protein [Rikenellaceae bacterium]